ncbi:unnamed protein product [Schistosoma mattheei]|uniref:Uncharacterized protein n=1 Tax=Schistosoma mattheei TaxID=31246 RepID=A0A183P528_9TREM|nr:unnamed protein product [Schistosoma mattheei]
MYGGDPVLSKRFQGCKKPRGDQCMAWCRGIKEHCTEMASDGPSKLHSWGPRDGATQWLETSSHMIQDKSQWRSYCNFLFLSS